MKDAGIFIPEVNGAIDLIYGDFGGGKNTLAAKIARQALELGVPVFSSFPVNFEGYNELDSKLSLFWGILGLKRMYKFIPKENFHRLTIQQLRSENFVEELFHMQKCVVIVDEGYAARLFDSYRKTNMTADARTAVYTTRHFDRRFIICAQRPNAIHVSSRGMVNRFYMCEQPLGDNKFTAMIYRVFGFRWFVYTQFQKMRDETVDETKPHSTRWMFATKKLLSFFNSKYMAEGYENHYPSLALNRDLDWSERVEWFFGRGRGLARALARASDSITD